MKENLKISVIIPTKNRAGPMKTMLDSLIDQSYRNFEVVVVDGGSTDNTQEVVEGYRSKFPIIFGACSGGLVKQENRALELMTGDIYLRTDDDAKLSPQILEEIVKTFQLGEDIGGVTGPTIIPKDRQGYRDLISASEKFRSGNLFWRAVGKVYFSYFLEGRSQDVGTWFRCGAFSLGANFEESRDLEGPIEVDYLHACNFAVRRELLEKIGGFDEVYGGIAEYNEADASFKFRREGYRLMFNPQAYLYHLVSQSGFYKSRVKAYGRMRNFIYFYLAHIKPNTLDKALRFSTYLLFTSAFWIYKLFETGNWRQLGGIVAIFTSFWDAAWKRKEYRC